MNFLLKSVFLFTVCCIAFCGEIGARDVSDFTQSLPLEITKTVQGSEIKVSCSSVAINRWLLLTAAHCLEGATEIKAVHGATLEKKHFRYKARTWGLHRGYDVSASNYQYDIGQVILSRPLPQLPFPKLSYIKEQGEIIRIGFGMRNGINARTMITGLKLIYRGYSFFELEDRFGVVGDSGGPIFQLREGELFLVGIHSTREGDSCYAATLPL